MTLLDDPTPGKPFDDPLLRETCRRAWGGDRAPAGLRERVATALRNEAPPNPRPKLASRLGPIPPLAAAAVLLLAVGGVTAYYAGLLQRPDRSQTRFAISPTSLIPARLALDLADVHDRCSGHHPHGIVSADLREVASHLSRELKLPVVTCTPGDLHGGGWRFCGGAVCPVGGVPAGHLVFVRGQASLSVFSMPARACPPFVRDAQCETTGRSCNIAAFRKGEGFFCVVGSSKDGSVGREQVRALRDQLRTRLAAAAKGAAAKGDATVTCGGF